MTRVLLAVLTVVCLAGCDDSKERAADARRQVEDAKYQAEQYERNKKTVIAKDDPVENRFSGTDFFFGHGSITKSKTVHYLIAEDKTVCEVDIADYATVQTGAKYSCDWKQK